MPLHIKISLIAILSMSVSGCSLAKGAGKVATLPVKGAVKTTKLAGKTVYHTGRLTGKGVYHTGKFAGKSVYYMGKVPVEITDRALSTTATVLSITSDVVDITGNVVTMTRTIQAAQLDNELANIRRAGNVLRVFVDIAG